MSNGSSGKPTGHTNPASNWWTLHNAIAHTSYLPQGDLTPLQELWHQTFTDALGFTQPIYGDGKLLVGIYGNGTEAFVALDSDTGNVLWTRDKVDNGNLSVNGTPVADYGKVFFVEGLGGANLTSLNIEDGSVVWSVPLPEGSQAGLASAFGYTYVHTRDGFLRAFDSLTGTEIWQQLAHDTTGSTLSSPAIGFGNVYVGTKMGIRAFNAINGSPEWYSPPSPSNGNASPTIIMDVGLGNPALVTIGSSDNIFRAYHITSGQILWTYSGDIDLWYTTAATANGIIYLMQQRTIIALDVVTGVLINSSPDLGSELATGPTIIKDKLFTITRDDRLVVLDLATLNLVEQHNIPAHPVGNQGSPSFENGKLFLSAHQSNPWPDITDTIYAFTRTIV